MRLTVRLAALSLAAAALLPLAGCGDSSGSGKLSLVLTDAPGQVSKAVVTISQIYLQGDNGKVVLRDTPVTTDLLTLANSTADLIKDAVIPTGTYGELRFVVTGAYVQLATGEVYASSQAYEGLTAIPPAGPGTVTGSLQMPSFGSSGLKVKLPTGGLVITDAAQKVLLVDFDVSQSFGQQAGGSGMWVMHPVVTATDIELAAEIKVNVALAQGVSLPVGASFADFAAVLSRDNGDGTTTTEQLPLVPSQDGLSATADFQWLMAGNYGVSLTYVGSGTPLTLVTTPVQPATLSVAGGQMPTVSFSVTGVN